MLCGMKGFKLLPESNLHMYSSVTSLVQVSAKSRSTLHEGAHPMMPIHSWQERPSRLSTVTWQLQVHNHGRAKPRPSTSEVTVMLTRVPEMRL